MMFVAGVVMIIKMINTADRNRIEHARGLR